MPDYGDWGEKPLPAVDPETEPFWAAAAEGRLELQHCADCGEWQHYPRTLCRHCGGRDLAVEPVGGTGTVYTYTVNHIPGQPGYGDETPYAVALVELDLPDENPSGRPVRLTTHVDCPPEALEVGRPVAVDFERVSADPEIALPVFRPRD